MGWAKCERIAFKLRRGANLRNRHGRKSFARAPNAAVREFNRLCRKVAATEEAEGVGAWV